MRLILPDAHRLNLRIVRRDLRDQVLQFLIEIEPIQVDHEPVRSLQQLLSVLQRLIGFDRHPRVIARGPHAHAEHGTGVCELRSEQRERDSRCARAQHLAATPVVRARWRPIRSNETA